LEIIPSVRRFIVAVAFIFGLLPAPAAAFDFSLLVPQPRHVTTRACGGDHLYARPLRLPANFDPGARALIDERWSALGIPKTQLAVPADATVRIVRGGRREHYRLDVSPAGDVVIVASDEEGVFDAAMTLAQLARPAPGGFTLPCVQIDDAPALRWRILSDDVSRGPLPTMRYFKERIRALAALKYNGYSIYMEHVFADAAHPIVAPRDGITPRQLRELRDYAARFHVAFVPQQQTLAHMHGTLRWEEFAPLAETLHGWLLSPANPGTYAYLAPLLREVASAAGKVPFINVDSDEPLDLGRGQSLLMVAKEGVAHVFASHVNRIAAILRPFGARPMIWDYAIQNHPEILRMIPKDVVIVDYHYAREASYAKYIKPIAAAGFDQMVSPGAWNWNEIYPRIDLAFDDIARFVADGRAAHVLGMFMTAWHDDGESLYEATWYPLAFAAASAWQDRSVDRGTFARAFAWAFFGSTDARWARSLERMRSIGDRLAEHSGDYDPSDYLFWADPFDAGIGDRVRADVDLSRVRLDAEAVLADLHAASPPLHANAAKVLALAARRYDALARRFQIGFEVERDYADARAQMGLDEELVYRDLNLAKYLCWELRDDLLAIEPLYRAAWEYESRPGGLGAPLTHFHLAEENAAADADRLNVVEREDYLRKKTLPTFEAALGRSR
jgi:hexosaminidase